MLRLRGYAILIDVCVGLGGQLSNIIITCAMLRLSCYTILIGVCVGLGGQLYNIIMT